MNSERSCAEGGRRSQSSRTRQEREGHRERHRQRQRTDIERQERSFLEMTARVTRADGVSPCQSLQDVGVTEVQTYPQHSLGLSPGLFVANTRHVCSVFFFHSVISVRQQAWCLILQVENNSVNCRERFERKCVGGRRRASKVHLTDRNLVDKSCRNSVPSSPLNTALNRTEKPTCTSRLRMGSSSRVRSR